MTLTQVDPPPTLNDWELTSRLSELFEIAKDQKRKFQSPWRRNYLLTTNRQYSLDVQSPWSPNITDSEIFPILSSRIAWMTDQKISAEISPAAEAESPFYAYMQTLGNHLESLINTVQQVTGWNKEVVLALWDAAQFGAGIFKAGWDSGLTTGLGNVTLKRVDPWTFYPDPNATSFDDCNYLFEVKKMTFDEIKRRFPSTADKIVHDAILFGDTSDDSSRPGPSGGNFYPMAMPGNLPGSSTTPSGSTGTAWGLPGQTTSTTAVLTEGINVIECWIRENFEEVRETTDPTHGTTEPVVGDSWRVVVYSGSVVLLDELAENLWEFSRHPYTRYVDEEAGEFWSVPIVSHLAPAQIAINRLLSAMQGNAELCGNPIFMDVNNSGLARTQIVNRPGLRLTMDSQVANSPGAKPDWLKPPEVSQLIPNLVQFWIGRMENISGISGVQRGQAAPGRQAQQTVQATQEAASVRIRQSLRNLERCLGESYTLLAHLIVQNYTIPRVVAIVGDDGTDTALRLAARHFYSPTASGAAPMKFSLIVAAGSSNPTSRQARIAEADALLAMHAIDPQAVLQMHNFPHWQTIVSRMQKQQQQMMLMQAKMMAEKKQPTGPGTGHEH